MAELTRRYIVMQMATEGPFDIRDADAPFVLKPWKDPAALRALVTYRDNCYPELRRDLAAWIDLIEHGAEVRGDVGRRNEPHVHPAGGDASHGTATRRARGRSASGRAKRAKRRRRR